MKAKYRQAASKAEGSWWRYVSSVQRCVPPTGLCVHTPLPTRLHRPLPHPPPCPTTTTFYEIYNSLLIFNFVLLTFTIEDTLNPTE